MPRRQPHQQHPQKLRARSSSLSSNGADVEGGTVVALDISTDTDIDFDTDTDTVDQKKQARLVSSSWSLLWQRARSSLVWPTRREQVNLLLPRYNVRRRTDGRADDLDPDEEVQLMALAASSASSRYDLDSSTSSDSLESADYEAPPPSSSSSSETSQAEEVLLFEEGASRPRHAWILRRHPKLPPPVDVEAYMARREMTKGQERWNALTVLPAPLYCLYYICAALWIPPALLQKLYDEVQTTDQAWPETWVGTPADCHVAAADGWWTPLSLPAWPPATILAIAAGVILHAPWSVLYHWTYAHALPAGVARTTHWSRRMDQAMLHLFCTTAAYGTSGSWDYMMASALFNADSAYRHSTPKVAPRRNKARLTLAIIAYSLPILRQGHTALFLQFWATMSVSMWLFATYPLGGWSHAIFHIVVTAILPLLFQAATLTASSQASLHLAAQCTVWQQPSPSWFVGV
jgi:hypothetical protein